MTRTRRGIDPTLIVVVVCAVALPLLVWGSIAAWRHYRTVLLYRRLNDLGARGGVAGTNNIWINTVEETFSDAELYEAMRTAGGALSQLDLSMTAVTDAGMVHLAKAERLRSLDLRRTAVTGVGLAELEAVQSLVGLRLDQSQATASGLAPLENLPNLARLAITDSRIEDDAFAQIGELSQLESLSLDGSTVDDVALAHIAKLSMLQSLALDGTSVTGPGLRQLAALRRLERLSLYRVPLTEEEVNALYEVLPWSCIVWWDEPYTEAPVDQAKE